jgi:HSP20 family protein
MVQSWGGVDTERDGDTDPIVLVGRRREASPQGEVTVELVETRTDDAVAFLRGQPQVISCDPASDGTFNDDTEGEIRIWGRATEWRPADGPRGARAPGGEEMMTSGETGMQTVPVKMYRSGERLMIAAPMPGLEPTDLRVEIMPNNRIVLRGGLRGIRQDEKDLLLNEWTVGNYGRTLDLPVPVNGPLANVTYDNGVLVIALPVAQQTSPAVLNVPPVGEAHGERIGNAGRPPQPTTPTTRAAGDRG